MKKKLFGILILLIIVYNCSFSVFADNNIQVYVDNVKVEFDVQPQLIGGRTMVPLRAIF